MIRVLAAAVMSLVLLAPSLGHSAVVTEEEALTIGENFIEFMIDARGAWGEAQTAEIVASRELRRGDLFLGYHLSVSPAGHMVVPSVRLLSPVKSFSFSEDFETESEIGYWQLLKDAMEHTLLNIEERYGPFHLLEADAEPGKLARDWDWLLGAGMAPASIDTVGPLMKTHWDQSDPYNDDCPMGDGGRCVVGCVATAGSMTMRYWRHPSHGTGSHSYFWDGDNSCGGSTSGQTMNGNFDDAYDWNNILRRYLSGYSAEEAAAVAELCSEVGIAWEMDYGACGSGAYTARGLTVYPTWFKYLDTINRKNRDNYPSAEAWFAVLKAEFDADPPRVIHYRISGHSINCDGYIDASTKYIHLNYGWGGSRDDWYAVDSLYCTWSGCDPMVEYALCGIEPGADFIDATSGPLADGSASYGASWADYDGDGDPDMYISNDGSANKLLRNDGAGSFTDVTASPLGDSGDGRGAAWADYDDDGDLDLYLCNTSGGGNKLFRNDAGTFVDVTSGPLGGSDNSEGAVWFDYDFDGDVDLYVANNGSANKILSNLGSDVFADATAGPEGDTGNGYSAVLGDYDNDGDPDLYLVNSGANKLLRNDLGLFTDVTAGPLGDTGNGRGAAWGDYDNDGDMDLYISNRGSANKLLRNDGLGVFTDITVAPLDNSGNGMGVAWIDCENDGDLDLYLANEGQANKVLRNRSDGTFQDATVIPLGDTGDGIAVACADYDGDGYTDIYVADSASDNLLFHNEYQFARHWLKVKLVGTLSNAAGIGARVRLVSGGRSQIREVSGITGYCGQNPLVVKFGLGDSTTVDTLEITWPSKAVWDTVLVAADQVVTIIEQVDLSGIAETGDEAGEFRLLPSHPNPFSVSTNIRFTLAESSPVALKVYDVAGRVVKDLGPPGTVTAGDHSVSWDRSNDEGQSVSSGIYFSRIEAQGFAMTRRLVLLR